MSEIISIRHEVGDTSEYTSVVDPDGDELNVTAGAALAGTTRGLAVTIDDADAVYGQYSIAAPPYSETGVWRVRYYIDPNSLTMANNDDFYTLYFMDDAGLQIFLTRLFYSDGYYIRWAIHNDAGAAMYGTNQAITDAPHYIELKLTRASSDVSSDGSLQLWIDGVDKETVSGIDNYDKADVFRTIQIGAIGSVDAGTSGTFYLDELVVRDDATEIGPYVPAQTSRQYVQVIHG